MVNMITFTALRRDITDLEHEPRAGVPGLDYGEDGGRI